MEICQINNCIHSEFEASQQVFKEDLKISILTFFPNSTVSNNLFYIHKLSFFRVPTYCFVIIPSVKFNNKLRTTFILYKKNKPPWKHRQWLPKKVPEELGKVCRWSIETCLQNPCVTGKGAIGFAMKEFLGQKDLTSAATRQNMLVVQQKSNIERVAVVRTFLLYQELAHGGKPGKPV